MTRHTAILGLSLGVLASACLGIPSQGSDPNRTEPATAPAAEADRPATTVDVAFDPNTDPNLVAWWRLDGDAADGSGNKLDGKPAGNPAWVQGRIGGAVRLDGTDDYIDCGNPPALRIRDRITAACWIKVEAFTHPRETILAKGDSSYRLSRAYGMSRTPYFACTGPGPESPALSGRAILTDNRWHHIAGVYDGAAMILYVDGREEVRKSVSGRIADTDHPLWIGENAERSGRFLKGLVDDVRVYNRPLRPEEIGALVGPHVEAGSSPAQVTTSEEPQGPPPETGRSSMLTMLLAGGMVVLGVMLVVAGLAWGRRERGQQEKVVWQIVRKELLLNLMTFRFAAAMAVCVILTAVFVPMVANDYQERLRTYRDNISRNEADLRTVKVYKNVTPTMFRAPSVLSVFSEGLEKRISDAALVELDKVPELRGVASQGNPYQAVFPVFDTSLIIKIVLSILALLVAYDAVSGERERGTLKLILAGAARRHQVLLGKLVAGLLVLLIPVTVTFLVGLVILLSFPMIRLSASDWGRIALMYVVSLIFVSAMYNVGLLFSCLTKRSAIALVLGLFLWILYAVIIPNGSVYLAAEVHAPEPPEKVDARVASLKQQCQTELDETRVDGPSHSAHSDAADAFGHGYPRLLNRTLRDYYQESYRRQFPLTVKYADRFWEAERGHLHSLCEQRQLADHFAMISPISLYDGVMSALAGTDLTSFQRFMEAVRAYRAQVVEYVRLKTNSFSLPSFFTPCTNEEVEEYERLLIQARQAKSPAEVAALFEGAKARWEKAFAGTPSLDLRDFPAFSPRGALGHVGQAVPGLALLILINVLFFALSFVAFLRYDVR